MSKSNNRWNSKQNKKHYNSIQINDIIISPSLPLPSTCNTDRMYYKGSDLPAHNEFSTKCIEMQLSQYQHQCTPVPSTGNVCPALWCRNMDHLGHRQEYTGGFPHEVSAIDTWYMLAGSCLQCRGASATWFVNHWWYLASSTLITGHVAWLDPGVPAYYALRLMVDTYKGRKPMASLRRLPGHPQNVWFNNV